jgi:hypothetical protein
MTNRAIEDLKSWLESAMPDSMNRRTTLDFVARVAEEAVAAEREVCAKLAYIAAIDFPCASSVARAIRARAK